MKRTTTHEEYQRGCLMLGVFDEERALGEGHAMPPAGDLPAMVDWVQNTARHLLTAEQARELGLAQIRLAENAATLNAVVSGGGWG